MASLVELLLAGSGAVGPGRQGMRPLPVYFAQHVRDFAAFGHVHFPLPAAHYPARRGQGRQVGFEQLVASGG
jgi:hypothetical protein